MSLYLPRNLKILLSEALYINLQQFITFQLDPKQINNKYLYVEIARVRLEPSHTKNVFLLCVCSTKYNKKDNYNKFLIFCNFSFFLETCVLQGEM